MRLTIDPNNEDHVLVYIPSPVRNKVIQRGFQKVTRTKPVQCWISMRFMLRKMREIPELGKWIFVVSVPKTSLMPNEDDPTSRFLVKSVPVGSLVSAHNAKGKEIWSNYDLAKTNEITTSANVGSFPNNIFAWGKAEDYKGNLTTFDDGHDAPAGTEEVDKIIKRTVTQPKKKEQLMDSVNISKVIRNITSVLESTKKQVIAETLTSQIFEEVDWSSAEGFEPEAEEIVKKLVHGLNSAFLKKKNLNGFKAVIKSDVEVEDDKKLSAEVELKTASGQKKVFEIEAMKDDEWNWLWKVKSGKDNITGSYPLQITRRDSTNIYKIMMRIVDLYKKQKPTAVAAKIA